MHNSCTSGCFLGEEGRKNWLDGIDLQFEFFGDVLIEQQVFFCNLTSIFMVQVKKEKEKRVLKNIFVFPL